MNTLTKEQIEQLAPGQQDTLATLELRRLHVHQRLLKKARSYFGRFTLLRDIIIAGGVLAVHNGLKGDYISSICLLALAVLITVHVVGINRRLDALLKLVDVDAKKSDPDVT